MAKFSGLGRGLDALMGGSPHQTSLPSEITSDSSGTLWISPALLKPNPKQPRRVFDDAQLQELADSIRVHGVLESILIEVIKDEATAKDDFFIVAGERRVRASLLAGLSKVPITIKSLDDTKRLEIALIENIQRTDLNPIEEARAYSQLIQISGATQDEVAKRVGKNRATVANMLRLLKLPQDVQDNIIAGAISTGHAKVLLSLPDESAVRAIANRIVAEKISVRETERLVHEALSPTPQIQPATQSNTIQPPPDSTNQNTPSSSNEMGATPPAVQSPVSVSPLPQYPAAPASQDNNTQPKDPNLLAIEQKFIDTLGTKVLIKGTLQRGSVVIDYYSADDLDRLYGKIAQDKAAVDQNIL